MTTRKSADTKTTGVHLSSATNSTLFTNCCGLAVNDFDRTCPGCGARVIPESSDLRHKLAKVR